MPALPLTTDGFLPETVNVCVLGVNGAIIAVRLTGVSEDAGVSVELVGDWQEKVRTARRANKAMLIVSLPRHRELGRVSLPTISGFGV